MAMLVGAAAAPSMVSLGGSAYDRLFPVTTNWEPASVVTDGDDVIVSGTMIKARCSCRYVPPPRARDSVGQNYLIVSTSPTASSSWACSGQPQAFGPWRVKGGAGKVLTFYQEHQCSNLWTSFTELGRVVPQQ